MMKYLIIFVIISIQACSYMGLGENGGKTKGCFYEIELLNGMKDKCESVSFSTTTYFWACKSGNNYAVKDVIYKKICIKEDFE